MTLLLLMAANKGGTAEIQKKQQRMYKNDAIRERAGVQADSRLAASMQTKKDREVKHPKLVQRLESRLIDAMDQAAAKGVQRSMAALSDSGARMMGENVVVIVQCDGTADPANVAALIAAKNGTIIRIGETHVKAAVPITALDDIASNIPGVSFVRTPVEKKSDNTVISEGHGAASVESWHTAGYLGQGVKVAVIDGNFAGLAELKAQDEIPASATEVDFSGTGMTSGSDGHGCACAEIIYDMAPGCQLYLLKALDSSDDEAAKNYCKAQGIKIISYSGGYDGINFYDGVANSSFVPHPVTIVNDASANGILWVNAAGNEKRNHAMITWRDDNANNYLDWASDFSYVPLWGGYDPIPAGTEIMAALTWNKWPTTDQDFDLILRYWNGSDWITLASSEDTQNGTQPPFEGISYTITASGTLADDYGLFIYKYSASSSPTFILRTYPFEPYFYSYGNSTTPAAGSITCPADAAASFAVGAIDCTNYASGPLEYFSSLGPNNGAYTGNPAVIKPDICGPDGVSTAAFGPAGFFGTSASAPHIAGLAALVKSAFPTYTNTQLKTYIRNHGVDLGSAGEDNLYGYGPCVLPPPPQTLIVTTPYGKANPAVGTNRYNWGDSVVAALTNSPVVNGTTQYVCTGWTGAGSISASGSGTNTGPFTLTNNSSIAWQWATNYWLDTVTNGNGTVNQADQWCRTGSNIVITATPSVSNRFAGWTGQTNGCSVSSNQISVVMDTPRQITANFIRQYSLAVVTPYGGGNPPAGANIFDSGTSVTAGLTNSPVNVGTTQFVCRGWVGTGNVPAIGITTSAGPFTITSDSTVIWQWRTNFWLDVVTGSNGGLSTNDCWLAAGTNLQVTATPSNYWHFLIWSGDTNGCTAAGNKITVVMNSPRIIQAIFAPNQYSLTVSNGLGGGSYTNGQQVTITAGDAPGGKIFDRWAGATQYVASVTSATATVTMPTSNIYVTADFAALIPGKIEAEDYDNGGAGAAYSDTTAGNSGGKYRNDDVDVETCSEGGYNLGYVIAGEWLLYSVNASVTADYRIETRIACSGTGGKFHIEVDGQNVTGAVAVPNTGGWQTWTNVSSDIQLAAGAHKIKLVMDVTSTGGGVANFNYLDVVWMTENGVPKWWMDQYSLTNVNDTVRDVDRDGLQAWQEYIAGTDPTNRASCFRIAEQARNVIGWDAVSGRVYSVYWATNLLTGFQCLESNIPWTQGSFTNSTTVPCGYYKLDVRLEQ